MPSRTGVWRILAISLVAIGLAATAASAEITPTTRGALAYLIAHSVGGFDSFVPPTDATYSDVPVSHPLYAEIEYTISLGIMPGDPMAGLFRPVNQIDRVRMALFTARAIDHRDGDFDSYVPPDTPTFPDVPPDDFILKYYYKSVEYIVAKGVTPDSSDGLFHPLSEMDLYQAADWLEQATGTYVDPDTIPPCEGPVGSIAGTVTDAHTAHPIPGATVQCLGRSTTTASDGSYLLSDVYAWSRYTVTANAQNYYSDSVTDVSVVGGDTTVVDFALHTSVGSIAGTVTDADTGQPLAGSTVRCGGSSATTAGDGTYLLTEIPEADGYAVTATAPNYYDQSVTDVSVVGGDTTIVDFALHTSVGSIAGTVTDAETGNPIASATVTCDSFTTTTDADGTYLLPDVPEGDAYAVVAKAPGYWKRETEDVSVVAEQTAIVNFELAPIEAETVVEVSRTSGFDQPKAVSVNSADGSCWVADTGTDEVIHLSVDGEELWRGGGFDFPDDDGWYNSIVCVNPSDGSCWVADTQHKKAVHLDRVGNELQRVSLLGWATSVSVNPTDGSCWVGVGLYCSGGICGGRVWKLAPDGEVLFKRKLLDAYSVVECVAVNVATGSCLALAPQHPFSMPPGYWRLFSIGSDGLPLKELKGYLWMAKSLSVDPRDASCWIADSGNHRVIHVAADGQTTLWSGDFNLPKSVSVNPTDGSCWVADTLNGRVWHLAEDGTPLWIGTGFARPVSVSANADDGSCWVADLSTGEVVHLAILGPHELSVSADCAPSTVSSAGITSCTATFSDSQGHGIASWSWSDGGAGGTFSPSAAVQNPTYTAPANTTGADILVHLTVTATCDGPSPLSDSDTADLTVQPSGMFSDVPPDHWACAEIEACVDAGIVQGYGDGTYQPIVYVSRDQMAVYISRALAGGESNVPEFTGTPSFTDVPLTWWALKHIEYAVANNVVQGYQDNTYHPEDIVDRAQMAVYVARAMVAPQGDAAFDTYIPVAPRNFPDVPSDSWGYKQIEYCVEHGVVQGYDDNLYHPEREVTRAQMAVYVCRAFGLLP